MDNDIIRVAPINGRAYLNQDRIKPGIWTKTIATAKSKDKGCISSGDVGKTCSHYGGGGSGESVIIQRTNAKDGGGNAVPYIQEIITITGAM